MNGETLTTTEAKTLRAILRRGRSPAPKAGAESPPEIAAGDVVQIRPFADASNADIAAAIVNNELRRLEDESEHEQA